MHPGEKLSSEIAVAKSAKELVAATRRFYRAADANADGAAKARGLAPACREGCALCCVFRVEVRAHEVFAIAEHIDATFRAWSTHCSPTPEGLSRLTISSATTASR
jgi:hypothetical protein